MRQPGYLRLSRKQFGGDDLLWEDGTPYDSRSAWVWLIQAAAWRDGAYHTDFKTDQLKRGEFVASLRYLANRWNWDKNKVARFLTFLEQNGRIQQMRSGQHGTVYLLVKYDTYNSDGDDRGTPKVKSRDSNGTPNGTPDGTPNGTRNGTRNGTPENVVSDCDDSISESVNDFGGTPNGTGSGTADGTGRGTAKTKKVGQKRDKVEESKEVNTKGRGKPAPWMGEIRKVWKEVYPLGDPPKGTANILRPLFEKRPPEEIVDWFRDLLHNTPINYLNIPKAASAYTPPGKAVPVVVRARSESPRLPAVTSAMIDW